MPEQVRWAEALAVEHMFGAGAAAFIEQRIATLRAEHDADGCDR